jgi:two-component system NtrC family sensor kinase
MSEAMNYTLKDLIDIPKLQSFLDALDEIHSLPSAIIDAEGNILTATAWQDICTKFHRAHPAAEKKCIESDTYIAKELANDPPQVVYKCPFGLVDTATPIIVEGRHLGNVFTGQLFIEPPDEEQFIRRAREYGFAEQDYLEALKKVPIISEERLRKNLAFLGRFTEMLAQQGLVHLRELEAAKVLQESERRYRDLFEANPHPMWVFDVQTLRFLSVNDAAVSHYGYSRDEFLSMTIGDICPKQDMPRLLSALERAAKDSGIDKSHARHRKRDGTLITVEITSHGLEVGGRRARLVTLYDITERTRAEEALKRSEALYHDLVSTSQDLIWQCDAEGRYVYLNPSWEAVFGYRIDEMLGKKFTDFQSAEAAGNDIKEFARLIQGNTVQGFETTHIGKDGRNIQLVFSAKAVFDAQGKVIGTRGTAYDITERKRTEEALQESERKYRDLVETSQDLIWTCDAKGRFTYLNPVWERVLGYRIEEMLGRRFGDFQIPDVAARDVEEFRKCLAGGSIMGYETTCRSRSGRDVCLIFNAKSLRDAAGPIIGTQGTAFDITEHKKTEEKASVDHRRMVSLLRISKSKTASQKELLDLALDEAVALSESELGYIYYYHEGKQEFTLHSWSNAVMKECSIADPPKTYQLEKTGLWGEAVRQRGPVIVNDFYAPHPLKRGYPHGHALLHRFMTLPVFIEGRIVAVVGVANKQLEYDEQDVLQLASLMDSVWQIAEHRRVDVEMRKLSQAVEQSPVSIVITDAKGNIEFVNPRFTQVTGYQAGEVLGRNPRVLKSGETPAERYKELWETITAGNVWEGEFYNKKKSGELFWEHAAVSPIRDSDGGITHYLGIKEDITERKKLEEQLRQAQKMEAIGQLAGGVAHDFNNILSTITGYASLLEMAITSDATLRDYVAEISVASERGANLTQSLLAFSRKQEASLAAVDLNDQIRSSHKVLSRLVGEDIDLVLDLDREDTVVEADAGQLQQVLMNLASNARDAMPNGGTLRIATKNVTIGSDHRERYALEHPGKYAILSMIDTGDGMEQAVRERIFEPFYTTKGVGKGTGLGLSIVYGIVKKHRGSITVDSEPGKGTVFSIYLPLTERSVRGRRGDEGLPQAAAGNRTILLVEDEETVRRVLRLTLEAYGYRVIEAVDGEDALRVFREHKDDVLLVLCDLVMPKKNGRQACEEMMKIRPDIKTIFMSGYTKDIFDQKGILESDITLLVKPVNPKDLVKKISDVLEGAHRPA